MTDKQIELCRACITKWDDPNILKQLLTNAEAAGYKITVEKTQEKLRYGGVQDALKLTIKAEGRSAILALSLPSQGYHTPWAWTIRGIQADGTYKVINHKDEDIIKVLNSLPKTKEEAQTLLRKDGGLESYGFEETLALEIHSSVSGMIVNHSQIECVSVKKMVILENRLQVLITR